MDVGWERAVSVWWSFSWRALLYSVIGAGILLFLARAIAALLGIPVSPSVRNSIYSFVGLPASIMGFKQALSRHLPALVAIAMAQLPPPGRLPDESDPRTEPVRL